VAQTSWARQQNINGWMGLVIRNATWIGYGSGAGQPIAIQTIGDTQISKPKSISDGGEETAAGKRKGTQRTQLID